MFENTRPQSSPSRERIQAVDWIVVTTLLTFECAPDPVECGCGIKTLGDSSATATGTGVGVGIVSVSSQNRSAIYTLCYGGTVLYVTHCLCALLCGC